MNRRTLARVLGVVVLVGAVGAAGTVVAYQVFDGSDESHRSAPAKSGTPSPSAPAPSPRRPVTSMRDVVPIPTVVKPGAEVYQLTADTVIHPQAGSAEAAQIADYLARLLRPATGFPLPVRSVPADGDGGGDSKDGISLRLTGADPSVDIEGYQLDVDDSAVVIRAQQPGGLFAGVQTLRQLLPVAIERHLKQPGTWPVSGGHIVDHPRFFYRGAMLDVSRHFFTVDEVKRYIDEIAMYKLNFLHLHLSDDQGWRIAISSRPRLATVGGRTETGGGTGGYYSRDDYAAIVSYAQSRYVTVVPELDLPGHTNAALTAYPELSCNGRTPPPYTKIGSPNTALCVTKEATYQFLDQVIGELAALTPGPYLHVGGDEAFGVDEQQYVTFVNRVQEIVSAHHKTMLGWNQITTATLLPSTVAEFWGADPAKSGATVAAARRGTKLILAPANHVYLDMKYNSATPLGLDWAGKVEVADAYGWDPTAYLPGVGVNSVLGVEAPLWSETVSTIGDVEYMAFPRLAAVAEIGWSPRSSHDWTAFKGRLGAQGPRWSALAINYYRSKQIPWAK